MSGKLRWLACVILWLGLFSMSGLGQVQIPKGDARVTVTMRPRLEPVAETRLIMEGLANANFRGLERKLTARPADDNAWTFARGQALLIAEAGNLLMMRPPKNQGQADWFQRSMDMRVQATALARDLGEKDYAKSRAGLQLLAVQCNRCHQNFRVKEEIVPFRPAEPVQRKVEARPARSAAHAG